MLWPWPRLPVTHQTHAAAPGKDHVPTRQKRWAPSGLEALGIPQQAARRPSADSSQAPEHEEGCWGRGSASTVSQGPEVLHEAGNPTGHSSQCPPPP